MRAVSRQYGRHTLIRANKNTAKFKDNIMNGRRQGQCGSAHDARHDRGVRPLLLDLYSQPWRGFQVMPDHSLQRQI
eukprot:1159896-Pelagomonas_calceolata.AAC.2